MKVKITLVQPSKSLSFVSGLVIIAANSCISEPQQIFLALWALCFEGIHHSAYFRYGDRLSGSLCPLYFIGEKGSAVKNRVSIFSTIFPEASEASRTRIHSGSATNRAKAALNSSMDRCPTR